MKSPIPEQIAGYEIDASHPLGEGAEFIVYLAHKEGAEIALKLPKPQVSIDTVVKTFRREAAALRRINSPHVVRLVEVSTDEHNPFLALELLRGESLARRLMAGALSENEWLRLARGMASVLSDIHRRGFVHRDLKPENIMLSDDGTPRLLDFGLCAELGGRSELRASNAFAGTLEYAAPEQLGLLQRPTDERSDLYALGVLLYQCSAGERPFSGVDANTLLRQHLQTRPTPLVEKRADVRPVFSAMVDKLLAKDPDDRYASARALERDLEDVARTEKSFKEVGVSALGQGERSRTRSVTPLFGRDSELASLQRGWENAKDSKGSLFVVSGAPGMGKSRLAQELTTLAAEHGGVVLSAKAQEGNLTSYAVWREAFDGYLERISALPKNERDERLARLETLSRKYPVSFVFSRRLSALLPESAERARALQLDARTFTASLTEFLLALHTIENKPVVFLLDDLQWLDERALEILEQMTPMAADVPMLLLLTARQEEKGQAAVRRLAQAAPTLVTHLELGPLDEASGRSLLGALLGSELGTAGWATELAKKSAGVPLLLREFAEALLDEGVLRPVQSGWVCDEKALSRVALTDDVLGLILKRVERLDDRTLELLSYASLMAVPATIPLLEELFPDTEVRAVLAGAARANLIELSSRGELAFVHDRMREALASRVSKGQLPSVHARLATLFTRYADSSRSWLLAAAHHARLGGLHQAGTPEFRVQYRAGQAALEEYSASEAASFFRAAGALLEKGVDPGKDVNVSAFYLASGEAHAKMGEIAPSLQLFEKALSHPHDRPLEAKIRHLRSLALHAQGNQEAAWVELQRALALVGAAFPSTLIGQALSLVVLWISTHLRIRFGFGFGAVTGQERERRQQVARMMTAAWLYAWFLGNPILLVQTVIRTMHNAHFLGASGENAKSLVTYAVVMSMLTGKRAYVHSYGARSIAMADQVGDREAIAYCRLMLSGVGDFSGETNAYREAPVIWRDLERYCTAWDQSVAVAAWTLSEVQKGNSRSAVELATKHASRVEALGAPHFASLMRGAAYCELTQLGRVAEAIPHRRIQVALAEAHPYKFVLAYVHAGTIQVALEQGHYFSEEVEAAIKGHHGLKFDEFYNRYVFINIAYMRLAQLREGMPANRKKAWKALVKARREAAFGPPPRAMLVAVHRAHLKIIDGAMAAYQGNYENAAAFFDAALEEGKGIQSAWAVYAAYVEYARLRRMEKRADATLACARAAEVIAKEQGWILRLSRLRSEFPELLAEGVSEWTNSMQAGSSTRSSNAMAEGFRNERFADALLEVSLASVSAQALHSRQAALLDATIRVCGSDRAFLFIPDDAGVAQPVLGRQEGLRDAEALKGYSTTLVANVVASKKPLLVTGTDEGEVALSASAIAHDLRSIMAAPAMVGDRLMAVLYVDSQVARGLFAEPDLRFLTAVAGQIGVALEQERMAAVERDKLALAKDLELVSTVQRFFLPSKRSLETRGMSVQTHYLPASQSGGDWLSLESPVDGTMELLVGDITGHGAPSAMMTAAVATAVKVERRNANRPTLTSLLHSINRELLDAARGEFGMTMAALDVSRAEGGSTVRITITGAGAPPLFLVRGGKKIETVTLRGTPLGYSAEPSFSANTIELEPGDRLIVVTDGLLEPGEGKRFSPRKFQSALLTLPSGAGVCEALVQVVREQTGQTVFGDDVTVVCLDVS